MFAPVVNRLHVYDVAVTPATRVYMDAMMALPAWQNGTRKRKRNPGKSTNTKSLKACRRSRAARKSHGVETTCRRARKARSIKGQSSAREAPSGSAKGQRRGRRAKVQHQVGYRRFSRDRGETARGVRFGAGTAHFRPRCHDEPASHLGHGARACKGACSPRRRRMAGSMSSSFITGAFPNARRRASWPEDRAWHPL